MRLTACCGSELHLYEKMELSWCDSQERYNVIVTPAN